MPRMRVIHSEVDIWKSIVKNFKHYRRTINQTTFYYRGSGADYYYDASIEFPRQDHHCANIAQLLNPILNQKKDSNLAIVSMGCGDCEKDKIIMEKLHELGHDFMFYGLDSSMEMISKASALLRDVNFKAELICADVLRVNFKKELHKIIGNYDTIIYLFLGNPSVGTILENLNQHYEALLNDLLRPGDYMLLDVAGFETITPQIKDTLLERYTAQCNTPAVARFLLQPLQLLKLPQDYGELVLKVTTDYVTHAQVFNFGFKVNAPFSFDFEEDQMSFSPDEHIDLLNMWVYDIKRLIEFLETEKFTLQEQVNGKFLNQLLLQKQ